MAKLAADEKWFKEQMDSVGLSQRKLAIGVGVDHSALSRVFSGDRKMSTLEAVKLAELLKVSVSEIVARSVGQTHHTSGEIPVVYSCNDGKLEEKAEPSGHAAAVVLPENALAARDENPQSPRYGWTFFFQKSDEVAPETLGRLSIVSCKDGSIYLGTLQRGFSAGEYNLVDISGEMVGAVNAETASPVLVVQP